MFKTRYLFHSASRLAMLLAVIFTTCGAWAAETQANRFLVIFETSSVMKKNLPVLHQLLGQIFEGNMGNQIQGDDELAIWTVDEKVHADKYALQYWSPDEAASAEEDVFTFLQKQSYTRHASLAHIQPLLDQVMRSSDRLTVLIFCDNKSQLSGTPYDLGVNETITNDTAQIKGPQSILAIVLRSYHGKFIGCSVNRSLPLDFPKFPAPPKPKLAPKPESVTVTRSVPAGPQDAPLANAPVPPPVPALIVVGEHASTNVSDLTNVNLKPAAPVAPATVSSVAPAAPAPANAAAPNAPEPVSAPKVAAVPSPTPVPNSPVPAVPLPATVPAAQIASDQTASAAPAPAAAAPASPQVVPSSTAIATTEARPTYPVFPWTLIVGGGLLIAAGAAFVTWLLMRARQPQSSLITSSMQGDQRMPGPK